MLKPVLCLAMLLGIITHLANGQTLPAERGVDWTLAGIRDAPPTDWEILDMGEYGVQGDGVSPNDAAVASAIQAHEGMPFIMQFPEGKFLFKETIELPSGAVIRGQGANSTTFLFDLGGRGHGIDITGEQGTDTLYWLQAAEKGDIQLQMPQNHRLSAGDWLYLKMDDSDWITSSWALGTVGQIAKVDRVEGNSIFLESPLRTDFPLSRNPFLIQLKTKKQVGIECLKLKRIDDTAPIQTSNIHFKFAVNCWVKAIASEDCNFCHIEGESSANLHVTGSYLHGGLSYGSGGRAYGVMLHFTTNECLIENNIFENLRHSMILQAGANGNVFAYNYSCQPFWENDLPLVPDDAAGDMVLHGNYPFANLFEQNICQHISIDNSHGPNGPFNTFLRNRAELYGIIFTADNSPTQNLLGNVVSNRNAPYSLVNYMIRGEGHWLHGNNNKGTVVPAGTEILPDESYAYAAKPAFVLDRQWGKIGPPYAIGAASIPPKDRFGAGNLFSAVCGEIVLDRQEPLPQEIELTLFPNPSAHAFFLESCHPFKGVEVLDLIGTLHYQEEQLGNYCAIDASQWQEGVYIIAVYFEGRQATYLKAIKK